MKHKVNLTIVKNLRDIPESGREKLK